MTRDCDDEAVAQIVFFMKVPYIQCWTGQLDFIMRKVVLD